MRDCGTCTACCRWPEIPEIKKPRGVPCNRLATSARSARCGHACTAYNARPTACKEYSCAWLEGHGHAADQPDKCGILLTRRDSQFGPALIGVDLGGPYLPKKKAIKRIARDADMICLVVDQNNPEKIVLAYGPNGKLEDYPKLMPVGVQ